MVFDLKISNSRFEDPIIITNSIKNLNRNKKKDKEEGKKQNDKTNRFKLMCAVKYILS